MHPVERHGLGVRQALEAVGKAREAKDSEIANPKECSWLPEETCPLKGRKSLALLEQRHVN